MENQVSGPLGTDVGSPHDSSQSATEAGQEPGPLTVVYAHKSFTPLWERKKYVIDEINKCNSTLSWMFREPSLIYITRK